MFLEIWHLRISRRTFDLILLFLRNMHALATSFTASSKFSSVYFEATPCNDQTWRAMEAVETYLRRERNLGDEPAGSRQPSPERVSFFGKLFGFAD